MLTGVLADQSEVLLDEHDRSGASGAPGVPGGPGDEVWEERESRNALKHVAGLGELQDVT